MPAWSGGLLVAAGAGLTAAAILARKRQVAQEWLATHTLPGPATEAAKAAANAILGAGRGAPLNDNGLAAYLAQRGNFVRGLIRDRVTSDGRVVPHWGVDIAAPVGTPTYSPTAGTVIAVGPINGYGNTVQVQSTAIANRSFLWAHLARATVRAGQTLVAGQQVGEIGTTTAGPNGVPPFTIGAHLHWEVHPRSAPSLGTLVERLDPVAWLAQNGVAQSGERLT